VQPQTPAEQTSYTQSPGTRHILPTAQVEHMPPPQSTSVSAPSLIPSMHDGAEHTELVHTVLIVTAKLIIPRTESGPNQTFEIMPARDPDHKLPNSAAVSDIRLENPHSLSYQPITRTSAPSTTAVCVASNVQDAGLWLKSMLTSGSVL